MRHFIPKDGGGELFLPLTKSLTYLLKGLSGSNIYFPDLKWNVEETGYESTYRL